MKAKDMSGFLLVGICIAVFLNAGLLGTCAAEGSYNSLYSSSAPQNAQQRAELFKALQNVDEENTAQATPYGATANIYGAMANPYVFNDPQAALEQANTYKALQKLNSVYSSSRSEDNWHYWTNMWLNEPQATGTANIYGAMANPYVFNDPQAALEQANTYKSLQKLNSVYSSSRSEDNWDYWTNMWLNEP
jgi:glutathione synthase/RimK-type ligase-like ATP-grasp enzyme